jgi:hypothetical protein
LSTQAAALSVRIDTQSQSVSVLSQQVSVLSQLHSVLSQQVSALSSQVSVVSVAVTSVDTRVNTVSNLVSVLSSLVSTVSLAVTSVDTRLNTVSNQVSIISSGFGGVQMRVNTNAQVISAAAFANVSGLSLSVTSASMYQIEGRVLFTLSIVTGTAFGFTYPGIPTAGSMTMECVTSVVVTGPVNMTSTNYSLGRIAEPQMSTVATVHLSILGGASATTHALEIYGLIRTGAAAGAIQLQAKQSATGGGVQILQGSYLRAYKVQ